MKIGHSCHFINIIPGLLIGVSILSGAILSGSTTHADDSVVTTTKINVEASCSLESNLDTPHTAIVPNGIYSGGSDYYPNGIGKTTLKAFCNDNEGFSIYAVGYSEEVIGNTYLKDSSLDSSTNIATGTNTSGSASNWAMKIGAVDGTYKSIIAGSADDTEKQSGDPDFSSYASVPSSYARVAYRNSGTDTGDGAAGSEITTTYAAYVSKTQPAGTYEGKVKYTLVHPASEEPLQPQPTQAGKICYYANTSSAVGTMGCQSVSTSSTSATLLASNFSRDGYGFAGWSDAYDYATNTNANFYGPQETINYTAGQYTGSNPGLSLYAVWIKSKGDLQNWTGCSSLTKANEATNIFSQSITALSDQRDNNTYAIAKLADGNCWMIENLRLESTNSDNSTGALAQGYGTSTTYGNFSGLADAESTGFTSTYTANSLYYSGAQEGTASVNIGTSDSPDYRMPRYNNYNNQSTSAGRPQNPTTNSATNSTTNAGMYSYGNYYTWHAAIADLTYNGTNNKSTTGTSLCPTGWHLPTGGSVTASINVTETPSTWREFYNLGYGIMGSVANDSNAGTNAYYNNTTTNPAGKTATAAFRSFPNNFLYSGYFATSSAYYRGSSGYYWSSTAGSSNLSYYLRLNSSNVRPGTYDIDKYYGSSIRCLAGS